MGAGRKTETYTLKEKSSLSSSINCSIGARNLGKADLAGVIFGCKHNTIKECFCKLLFGLPAAHISYVKHIRPGLPLFLFNYSDRKLHGIFEAASEGRMNIDPRGWTENGSECTPFPAQVRIQIQMQCQPLLEDQFGPVIANNYFQSRLFWFELDQNQTSKLISMFSSSPVSASTALPKRTAKLGNSNHSIVHSKRDHTGQSSLDTHGLDEENRSLDKSYSEETNGVGQAIEICLQSYCSLVKDRSSSLSRKKWSDLFPNSITTEKVEVKEIETLDLELNLPTLDQFNSTLVPPCNGPGLEGKGQSASKQKDSRSEKLSTEGKLEGPSQDSKSDSPTVNTASTAVEKIEGMTLKDAVKPKNKREKRAASNHKS